GITFCTFSSASIVTMPVSKSLTAKHLQPRSQRNRQWKKHEIGRERPHFFGFQPPKNFVGSPPPAPSSSGPCFFHRQQKSRNSARQRVRRFVTKKEKTIANSESTAQTSQE